MEKPRFESSEVTSRPFLETEELVTLAPEDLVEYLDELDLEGRLEEFLERAESDDALVAQLSYWEKWLKRDKRDLVEEVVAKKRKIYGEVSPESLPLELQEKYDDDELQIIMTNLRAIQLTFGCSKGCPFCGVDAVKGVRDSIAYGQLANMFQRYGDSISYAKPVLYWASEPSDYEFEDRTYQDVHQLAHEYAGYSPHITTKESSNEDWLEYIKNRGNTRLSGFGMTEDKIELIQQKVPWVVGVGSEHSKGMGVSAKNFDYFEDDKKKRMGVACHDGLLMTPRGLYNMAVVPISRENPQGQIIVPLEDIGDGVPRVGDYIKELMQHGVVRQQHHPESFSARSEDDNLPNVYYGDYPMTIYLQQKELLYKLEINEMGDVISVEESGNRNFATFWEKKKELLQDHNNWHVRDYADLGDGLETIVDGVITKVPEIIFPEPEFKKDKLTWHADKILDFGDKSVHVYISLIDVEDPAAMIVIKRVFEKD